MPFSTQYRYFAFAPTLLDSAATLRDGFGDLADTAPDHNGEEIKTLLCGLDNAQTGKLRALVLGETAKPIELSDGRLCLGGYWTEAVIDAFESSAINGEELTKSQVKDLQPEGKL